MIPVSLELKNFGPFVDLYVPMEDYSFCLLLGDNRDEPGMDSNAVGKSFFLDACYWVMTGEIARTDKKVTEEIINWDAVEALGRFVLNDEGTIYYIERMRGQKNRKSLKFGIVGDPSSERRLTGKTDTETQKNIYGWLGADAEAIVLMIYYGQGAAAILVNKGPTERVRALAYLYPQIQECDKAREEAIKIRREVTRELDGVVAARKGLTEGVEVDDIEEIENGVNSLKKKAETVRKALDKVRQLLEKKKSFRSKSEIEHELNNARQRIKVFNSWKEEYQQAIEAVPKLKGQIKALKFQIEFNKGELGELEPQMFHLKGAPLLDRVSQDRMVELSVLISQANKILKLGEACPVCFAEVTEDKRKFMTRRLRLASEEYLVFVELENTARSQRSYELDAYVELINEVRSVYSNLTVELKGVSVELNNIYKCIETHEEWLANEGPKEEDEITQHITALEESLRRAKHKDKEGIEKLEKKVREGEKRLQEWDREIGVFEAQLDMAKQIEEKIVEYKEKEAKLRLKHKVYDFLVQAFAELKLVIIDNAIPQFQSNVNDYLKKLGISKRVRFETQIEFKSQEGVEDRFEIFVSPGPGREEVLWEMYSGGEKRRLSLAFFMAMNDMAHQRAERSIEFAFFDEITESLDVTGQKYILELLQIQHDLGKRIWVISHLDQVKNSFPERMTFVMEGGVSTLEVG